MPSTESAGAADQDGAFTPEYSERAMQALFRQHLVTSVYLQCARFTRFTIEDLDTIAASEEKIRNALEVLTARGLVARLDEDTWLTHPPDQALSDQATRLEEQAATIRAATPGLARSFYEARASEHNGDRDVGVELLDSLEEVNVAMAEMFASARKAVVSMRTDSPRVRWMMQGSDPSPEPVRNSVGDPLNLRVTFDTSLLEDGALPPAIMHRARVDELRFSNNIPFTATTSDTGITVMDLQNERTKAVGVRITHPDVSAAIRTVIESAWVHGWTWAGSRSTSQGDSGVLDTRDEKILTLLVSGATDAAIARQVGISQRTVERRVRRLLERLHATTRFQAGVLAGRRGWI
ncbi:LuxR C-terminal-related transcriptional regulator [Demetria terragena]|uniref:LuxR C-terminal-related transcriptional regulator n=1 Tax=Demetria terragena TaxID=63959 RepID=UPI00037A2E0E|nr:LuxR C-terminal-related transcriptional regulator [Demetria terragena]